MPTEELEHELRSALARAAADIPDPEQARQRLLHRDYRAGRDRRQLAVGAAAGAAVLGLGLTGLLASIPAHHPGAIRAVPPGDGTIRTTAFTLVKHANGTATLTINGGVLLEPSVLQSDLEEDGIPAIVTSGSFCSSDPTPAGFQQVVTGQKQPMTLTINPAAIPDGAELSFGYFQASSSQEAIVALVTSNSYTCTNTAPTSPPAGVGLMTVHSTSGSGSKAKAPLNSLGTIVHRRGKHLPEKQINGR